MGELVAYGLVVIGALAFAFSLAFLQRAFEDLVLLVAASGLLGAVLSVSVPWRFKIAAVAVALVMASAVRVVADIRRRRRRAGAVAS